MYVHIFEQTVCTATPSFPFLNPEKGEFTKFENRRGDSRSILPGGMQAILRDPNGNIWSGMDAGVSWMTPEPLLFQHFDLPNVEGHEPPVIPFPHSFLEITDDSLLLTGIMWTSELGLFDLKTNQFIDFIQRPKEAPFFRYQLDGFDEGWRTTKVPMWPEESKFSEFRLRMDNGNGRPEMS